MRLCQHNYVAHKQRTPSRSHWPNTWQSKCTMPMCISLQQTPQNVFKHSQPLYTIIKLITCSQIWERFAKCCAFTMWDRNWAAQMTLAKILAVHCSNWCGWMVAFVPLTVLIIAGKCLLSTCLPPQPLPILSFISTSFFIKNECIAPPQHTLPILKKKNHGILASKKMFL